MGDGIKPFSFLSGALGNPADSASLQPDGQITTALTMTAIVIDNSFCLVGREGRIGEGDFAGSAGTAPR
jgi:hypothetical protein